MIKPNRLTEEQYDQNFSDIKPPFLNKEAAEVEANRCLYCFDAPCIKGCPTSIDIPKFIKQIASDNIKGSAHTIFVSNIFGNSCAKVCPVEKLCEGNCVYNLLNEPPIPIGKLQRYATDPAVAENWSLFERKPSVGKKVAVVGAGPAGLSCAHVLSREGIDVTVFEKESKGGGLVTYGIAAYKVTDQACEDEVDYITSLGGIDIRYNQTLGVDFSLADLQKDYDAVFLAIGIGLAGKLNIPGEDLAGVEDAIQFIYNLRTHPLNQIPVGDKVVVIGMGNTAIDAATQSKRLGAGEVTLIYRRTIAEKTCTQHELDIALTDGCMVRWLTSPKEIIGEAGKVKAIVCDVMKLGAPDKSGRPAPEPTGETITIEADMIIKATGQKPYTDMINAMGIENDRGKIKQDHTQTNLKGVFAGGDSINGGKEAVDAVQTGKDGAAAIMQYLNLTSTL